MIMERDFGLQMGGDLYLFQPVTGKAGVRDETFRFEGPQQLIEFLSLCRIIERHQDPMAQARYLVDEPAGKMPAGCTGIIRQNIKIDMGHKCYWYSAGTVPAEERG